VARCTGNRFALWKTNRAGVGRTYRNANRASHSRQTGPASAASAKRTGWKATVPPYRGVDRDPSDMATYAGMGVGDVNRSQPAAEGPEIAIWRRQLEPP
jgi:hypothetical protein